MTARKASNIIQAKLKELGLEYKTTAHTVSFSYLLGTSAIFVRIHQWNPKLHGQYWEVLKEEAHKNGFCIESYYG